MKKFLIFSIALCAVGTMALDSAWAGSGKGDGKTPISIEVSNLNDFMEEDVDIRVWILTEEEAQTPPATKAEADALESVNVPPFATAGFARDAGNYVIVAANETVYQGLADDDPFSPGESFNVLAVTIEDGDLGQFKVVNSGEDNLLPNICPLDDGSGG